MRNKLLAHLTTFFDFVSILVKKLTRLNLQQFCDLQKSINTQFPLSPFNAANIIHIKVCSDRQLLLSPSFLVSESAHIVSNYPVDIHRYKIARMRENVIPTDRRYSERTYYGVVFFINNIINLQDIFSRARP